MKTSIERWREADGDNTFALDWPLGNFSHVWEIGGFEGRWAQQVWDKFHCNIHIFEPQDWAVDRMRRRFRDIGKIKIYPFGLWLERKSSRMGRFYTDGASMLKEIGENEESLGPSQFEDYFKVMRDFNKEIKLCLMNIEGAEYFLLPDMVKEGAIKRFEFFWCQFHPEDESDQRHLEIFEGIEKTHERIWDFYPTAVAWRRK